MAGLCLESLVSVVPRGTGRAFSPLALTMGLATLLLALSACSPTFNWRELRLEGAPLQALMPCKPETAQRSVPLMGKPTALHLLACAIGGVQFAIA